MANNQTVNNGVTNGQTEEDIDQPYSVARYETTSGPWHNILDVPGTETWPGQPVYTAEDSPNGSAVAIYGSDENLPRTEDGDKKAKHKKTDKKGGKSDHKKDKKDGDAKGKHHHGHKSHGHGHSSHRAA